MKIIYLLLILTLPLLSACQGNLYSLNSASFLDSNSNNRYSIGENNVINRFNNLHETGSMLFNESDARFIVKELYSKELISSAFKENSDRKDNYLKFTILAKKYPAIQIEAVSKLKIYTMKGGRSEIFNIEEQINKDKMARNLAIREELKKHARGEDYKRTENIIFNQWDEASRIEMQKDLQIVGLLHDDVMSGMFSNLQPIVNRLKSQANGNDISLNLYKLAAQEFYKKEEAENRSLAIREELKKHARGEDYKRTENIIFNQWDEASRIEMQKDLEIVGLLHDDVMSGMFSNLQPIVNRLKSQANGNDTSLNLYKLAAQKFFKKEEEDRKQKFLATLEKIEKNESAIRAKLKWSVETKSEKELQLVSVPNNSKQAKKLKAEVEYLDAEVKDLSFWINALDNKRNIEKQRALRNEQERIAAEKRQDVARQDSYRRAMAQAAQRQAKASEKAAADARYQNSLNSLNSTINQMNQNLSNSINSYQSPYSSPYKSRSTTYRRFGNSIYGSDGTNCQSFGNSMYCR